MHIPKADTSFADVLVATYENVFLSKTLGYSEADEAYADLIAGRDKNQQFLSLGHSGGTIVQANAFDILKDRGYSNSNMSVMGAGGAVKATTYTEKARALSSNTVTYEYFKNDPVPVLAGSNLLTGPTTPVSALAEFWNVYHYPNSAHSCYGTGATNCATIAHPVAGGPVPLNQNPSNLVRWVNGKRVKPDGK